jgi:transglycosylase-like protein with SLT domain
LHPGRALAITVAALSVTGIAVAVTRPPQSQPSPVRLMSDEFPASFPWRGLVGSENTPVQPSPPAPSSSLPRQLIVPDLIAAVPTGITAAQLARISMLAGVRAVLPLDGGQVRVDGKPANVIGVDPQAFRSWTPPPTAADSAAWSSLASGGLLAATAQPAAASAQPAASTTQPAAADATAQVAGATRLSLADSAAAPLGIAGVNGVVDEQRSAQLGLIKNLAVLINAPGADLTTLMAKVRAVLGVHGKVVNLVQVVRVTTLPVAPVVFRPGEVPVNYLALYKDSAAEYCPGLSWTVLASIGEIESGDGANDGPSSAGALGPMQFMPGTWAIWGTDGFGQKGSPDIMNPLDAVPSAARLLCGDGATTGAKGLSQAIFDYNHAVWYVVEVLELANEYAKAYS